MTTTTICVNIQKLLYLHWLSGKEMVNPLQDKFAKRAKEETEVSSL
jgi:hypothetical protein